MKKRIVHLCKCVVEHNGNVEEIDCGTIKCNNCPFSPRQNYMVLCGEDTSENYMQIAKSYIEKYNDAEL